jgi:hypothetical protein
MSSERSAICKRYAKPRHNGFCWLLFPALLLLTSCNLPTDTREFPFGVWKADPGYTILVRKNNTYRVCEFKACETGTLKHFPKSELVELYGFCEPNHRIGRKMVAEVGNEDPKESDEQLCEAKMFPLYANNDMLGQFLGCRKMPCLILDQDDNTRTRNISYYGPEPIQD